VVLVLSLMKVDLSLYKTKTTFISIDTSAVEDFMRSRPHTIDDRQIDPKRASTISILFVYYLLNLFCLVPREEQNSSEAHLTVKKLFVAGLREGINEDSLRQYFSRFGNVVEVLVMKDRDG
jgi:heterogeneous nuclear ribonucleoprotein A1/A3